MGAVAAHKLCMTKNNKSIATVDTTGSAHSDDGKYTAQNRTQASDSVSAGLVATVKADAMHAAAVRQIDHEQALIDAAVLRQERARLNAFDAEVWGEYPEAKIGIFRMHEYSEHGLELVELIDENGSPIIDGRDTPFDEQLQNFTDFEKLIGEDLGMTWADADQAVEWQANHRDTSFLQHKLGAWSQA